MGNDTSSSTASSTSPNTASTASGGLSMKAMDGRARTGVNWAISKLGLESPAVSMVAGDASFRRYLRIASEAHQWILMDAPPEKENSAPFLDVTERLRNADIHAPEVIEADLDQGFLLLEDLGDALFRDLINEDNPQQWIPRLIELLATMARDVDANNLPSYSRKRLQDELELFPTWYLREHLQLTPSCAFFDYWEAFCTDLLNSAEAQPQVFVHRDFHSCNLLLTDEQSLGVIDYQDAVQGPLSYDLASLLWDRYITWPRTQVEEWTEQFRALAAPDMNAQEWQRQVDWMGLQRNIKIVGIFARLHHRDGKTGYVEMIPQFWAYLQDVLPRYPRFHPFLEQLEQLECAP